MGRFFPDCHLVREGRNGSLCARRTGVSCDNEKVNYEEDPDGYCPEDKVPAARVGNTE